MFGPRADEVVFDQTLQGAYHAAPERLTATSAVVASRAGAPIADANLEVEAARQEGGGSLTASLTVGRVTADALNIGLAGRAGARFKTGEVSGHIVLDAEGDSARLRSSMRGDALQLRVEDGGRTTPPLAVAVEQAATFDGTARTATLDALDVTVLDGTRTVVSAHLDQPLRVDLAAVEPQDEADRPAVEPALLSLRVNELGLADLRPWLSLGGTQPLSGLREGTVQGLVRVLVQDRAELVEVNGRVVADGVTVEGSEAAKPAGPFRLEQKLRLTLSRLETLTLDEWETSLTAGGAGLGSVRASGSLQVRPRVAVETLTARMALDGLDAEVLNPLLVGAGGTRLAGARVSGSARVEVTGTRAEWNADLRGRNVRFALPGAAAPTPAVDVVLAQTGRFDRDTETLTLERLKAQVLEQGRPVLTGDLDQPLTLGLSPAGPAAGAAAAAAPPIHLTLEARRLALRQLKPWLALSGNRALEEITGGALEGRLGVTVRGQGESVTVDGHLDGAEIGIRTTEGPLGPFGLRSRLEATVTGRSRLSLKLLLVRVLAGSKELVQVQVSGTAEDSGALDLATNVLSGDLTNALGRLGAGPGRTDRVAGGELSATLRVQSEGGDRPVRVVGEATTRNLRVLVTDRERVTASVVAQVDVEVDATRSQLRLTRLGLEVQSGREAAGRLTVAGTWPLGGEPGVGATSATPARPGEVVITARDLDAGPLLDLAGFLSGRAPGPVRLVGETTVTQDPASRQLRARGRTAIGPLAISGAAAGGEPATLDLTYDVTLQDSDLVRVARLTLTSDRRGGLADDVQVSGLLRLGARPRLELRGAIDALDAGWYAALTSVPEGAGTDQTAKPAAPEKGTAAAADAGSVALPLDLDVDVTIGTVAYRTLRIGSGRLVGTGTGSRAEVRLEPTGLADGTLQGTLTVAVTGGRPEYAWTVKGSTVDVGALFQALQPAHGPVFSGRASFSTSGTGRGTGAVLKKSLSGTAVLEVTDGRFMRSALLAFIAEQTKIKQFEHLGFQTLRGELRLADGWVDVPSLEARGPGVAIEATGKVSLEGELDLSVAPKVTGAVADSAKRLCFGPLLTTVDDWTRFPFGVRVTGTVAKPTYGVTLTVADTVRRGITGLPSRVLQTLKDCGNLPKAGRQLAEEGLNILKGASDVLEGLFGTGRSRDEPRRQ